MTPHVVVPIHSPYEPQSCPVCFVPKFDATVEQQQTVELVCSPKFEERQTTMAPDTEEQASSSVPSYGGDEDGSVGSASTGGSVTKRKKNGLLHARTRGGHPSFLATACGHELCTTCMRQVGEHTGKCPLCRADMHVCDRAVASCPLCIAGVRRHRDTRRAEQLHGGDVQYRSSWRCAILLPLSPAVFFVCLLALYFLTLEKGIWPHTWAR